MNTYRLLQRFTSEVLTKMAGYAMLALALYSFPSSAGELLKNGSFTNGLAGWQIVDQFSTWNPLQPGSPTLVNLHPPITSYKGVVLYQNLNVPVASGQSLTLSLQAQKMSATAGAQILALYVDYATNGLIVRTLALRVNNDAIPTAPALTNLTATFSLPANVKLVRLVVAKEDNGQVLVGNFSLTGAGLTPGNVPTVTGYSPVSGPYQTQIKITGTDLGTNGSVYLAKSPVDLVGAGPAWGANASIVSWTPTQIVARVVEPNRSGAIHIQTGGVENNGSAAFTLTSPNFTVDAKAPEITVIRGQKALAIMQVSFLNGFQSAGGVSFFMPTAPGASSSISSPLKRSGGYAISLDTAGLAAGSYQCTAQSLSESYARFVDFKLKVLGVTNIIFTTGSPATNINSLNITLQNQFTFGYQLIQSDGKAYGSGAVGPPPAAPVTVTTSNPDVVFVSTGNMGGYIFYAVGDGTANLQFTTPDGFSATLPVTVALPATPRVSTASSSPGIVDNSGLGTNVFFWQGVGGTPSSLSTGYPGLMGPSGDFLLVYRDYVNMNVQWIVGVPEGTQPGTYFYHANIGDDYTGVTKPLLLTVVNAASRGQIAGSFFTTFSGNFMMEIGGNMEVYDASGNGVITNNIWSPSGNYLVSYLSPGAYKLRFTSYAFAPMWYPNAATFADAQAIQVQAGQTVSNISFCMMPVVTPPQGFNMPAPMFNYTNLNFSIATTYGVMYHLEYKDALSDANWNTAQTLTGDGGARMLADPASSPRNRFYRLRMVAP